MFFVCGSDFFPTACWTIQKVFIEYFLNEILKTFTPPVEDITPRLKLFFFFLNKMREHRREMNLECAKNDKSCEIFGQGDTSDTPPSFLPARSAGKFFSKEIPNKNILLRYPPSFPEKPDLEINKT